jgi:hypothetical protein
MARVIQLKNDDGTTVDYRPVADRIPGFLEKFSHSEGWGIQFKVTMISDDRNAKLVELYKTAIQAGAKPAECGLPPLSYVYMALIEGTLLKNGVAMNGDATVVKFSNEQEFKAGFTAARQRILAAEGMGGQVFDEDENHDRKMMKSPFEPY